VIKERGHASFSALSLMVSREKHSDKTEKIWMEEQGPCCPALIDYLHGHGKNYDTVLFMTYLYYPTALGIREPCRRKILIPTAHDEWPIYQRQFIRVFEQADAFVYNAPAEKRFVEKMFPAVVGRPGITIGAGVTYPQNELPSVEERFGIRGQYLCYSGRIDPSKGCDALFQYFQKYQERHENRLQLVLTGRAAMEIPDRPDIHALGFVSEEEKYAVMKDAAALVLASEFESLSIVVLESMMMGRPVLVNGKCEVLKDHCTMSNAGFYFYSYEEFEAELDYLLENPAVYAQMCENGKTYVREHYQWEHIIRQLVSLINA
jgi:glycosyltransferase involved in cell wall biosynthesis